MRRDLSASRLFMTADAVGGVFQYALDLARGLDSHDVQITLAMLGPPMDESRRALAGEVERLTIVETGLPLDWLAPNEESVVAAAQATSDLAAWHRADIVHLNTPALAIAGFSAPVVVAAHSCLASWWESVKDGAPPEDFTWRTRLTARGLEAADAVVSPSRSSAKQLAAIYGREAFVVHNGRSAPNSPSRPGGRPGAWALTAGRLWDEGKNLSTLDAAAGSLEFPIFAAGPLTGPNGATIEPRYVRPLGSLGEPELRAHLAQQPIFVSAALYEPFGLTVLEAAQAGCALILSDIATFRELWDGAALFAPAKDPHAFARAVTHVATDFDLRADLSHAARRRAENHSIDAMATHMAEIYGALLELSGTSRRGAAA